MTPGLQKVVVVDMIKSIISAYLREYYQKGTNVKAAQSDRLGLLLGVLDVATKPDDLRFPKAGLGKFPESCPDFWSVEAGDGNRIVFRFENGDVLDVDMVPFLQNQVQAENILVKGPMKNPPHPGQALKQLYLAPLELTAMQAAQQLGILRKTLSQLIKGHQPVTSDIALRLSKNFNTTPHLWLNLQHNFNLRQVENIDQRSTAKHFHSYDMD